MSLQTKQFYEFGQFRLDAEERLLLHDGEVVPLTPKAFDLLLVLVEHHGHLVGKEELLKAVWPDTFVEEANLSTTLALRKAVAKDSEQRLVGGARRGVRLLLMFRSGGWRMGANGILRAVHSIEVELKSRAAVKLRIRNDYREGHEQ